MNKESPLQVSLGDARTEEDSPCWTGMVRTRMKMMMMTTTTTVAVARRRKREKEENTIRQALCKQSSRNGYYLLWFPYEMPSPKPRVLVIMRKELPLLTVYSID